MFKCIVCYKQAEVSYCGTTYCYKHFESLFTFETGKKVVGKEKEWGQSVLEMKKEYANRK